MTTDRSAALRALSASLRAGRTMREALVTWDDPQPEIAQVSRRLRLGCSLCDSLESARSFLGHDLDALRVVVELHRRTGGDAAAMIDAIAHSIDRREAGAGRAEAAVAGARLSARLVAGLPLAALLFLPGSRSPLLDPIGVAVVAVGLCLCLGGMRWMTRLLPAPREEVDEAGLLAVIIASAVRSGCSPDQVLNIAAERPGRSGLVRARRCHRLGLRWPDALARSTDGGLSSLGALLGAPQAFGVPIAEALDRFARGRAESAERDLERAIRRAPVKMVVPLTVCVLPSFALLALTPFLRSLSPA